MLAKEIMTQGVEVCTDDETAAEAIAIMMRRNCGFIPIVRDHFDRALEGVVTDRDLALYFGWTDKRPSEVLLKDCMSRRPITVFEDTNLHQVALMMEEHLIHRIPVINHAGKLVGIITLKDLAEEAWRAKGSGRQEVTDQEIGEIVESISIMR